MKRILDNPKEFFDNLSKEEFAKLLDDYGFEYIDRDELKISLMYKNKNGVTEGIVINNIPKPNLNGYCEVDLDKEDVKKLIDTFSRILNEEDSELELKPLFKIE